MWLCVDFAMLHAAKPVKVLKQTCEFSQVATPQVPLRQHRGAVTSMSTAREAPAGKKEQNGGGHNVTTTRSTRYPKGLICASICSPLLVKRSLSSIHFKRDLHQANFVRVFATKFCSKSIIYAGKALMRHWGVSQCVLLSQMDCDLMILPSTYAFKRDLGACFCA